MSKRQSLLSKSYRSQGRQTDDNSDYEEHKMGTKVSRGGTQ